MKIPSLFKQDKTCIRKPSTSSYLRYETKGVDELCDKIRPHFNQYPLVSEKQNDFICFERVLDILRKEKKLTKKSLLEIIDLAYQMNLSSANDKSFKKEAKEHWLKIIEDNY